MRVCVFESECECECVCESLCVSGECGMRSHQHVPFMCTIHTQVQTRMMYMTNHTDGSFFSHSWTPVAWCPLKIYTNGNACI